MLFRKPAPVGAVDFLIVGLGNPGKKYEGTRHNAGFMVIEALAEQTGTRVNRVKFKALCGETVIGNTKALLMMPQTFMNNSGEAVREAMAFYKLPPEKCLVLCDDISLAVGNIRLRRKGSDGGQRGMRSIITLCGSDQFPRIKLGVGQKPHPDYDLAAWVLSRFPESEKAPMRDAVKHAAEAVALIVAGDMDTAMNRYSK